MPHRQTLSRGKVEVCPGLGLDPVLQQRAYATADDKYRKYYRDNPENRHQISKKGGAAFDERIKPLIQRREIGQINSAD